MYKKLTWAEGEVFMSKFNSSLGFEKIDMALSEKNRRVHFVGVGGIGMYSLFLLTADAGIAVTGSDKSVSERSEKLRSLGYVVNYGHRREYAENSTLLVYSLAVDENNPELAFAAESEIPAVSRAEYLAYLMKNYKTRISVSGSHGKSTVTAMLTSIFRELGTAPTSICGASLPLSEEPYILGEDEYFIFEGCEYKDSFLEFETEMSVYTNLELDHTDYFKTLDDIKRSFVSSFDRAKISVINNDDENLVDCKKYSHSRFITYGVESASDFQAVNIKEKGGKYSFAVEYGEKIIADISLNIPGRFSVYNALAAFSAAYSVIPNSELISKAISDFSGIERRFQKIAEYNGAPVIYDYAHHPTEIASVINTAKILFSCDVNVIFKPHTYTRTHDLWDGFVDSLSLADKVFILEVDAIRENRIEGVNARCLAQAIGDKAKEVFEHEIIKELNSISGAIIVMGAGDLEYIKKYFADNSGIDKKEF